MKLPIRKAMGALAAAALLTAAANAQTTFTYTGADVPIPDNGFGTLNGAVATLNVTGMTGNVTDLNLLFPADGGPCAATVPSATSGITHSWVGDIRVRLTHVPTGTTALLIGTAPAADGSNNNFCNITLDDSATTAITAASTNPGSANQFPSGSYLPTSPLSAFNGIDPNGTWEIRVFDNASFDTGSLLNWAVQVTTAAPGTPAVSVGNVAVTEGNSGTTNAVVTVTTDIPAVDTINLTYSTANGTATTANGDYVSASAVPISIATGDTSTSFTLTVNGDTNLEGNETFAANVSLVSGTASILDGSGTVTINNDDFYDAPLAFGADFFAGPANEVFILDAANPTTGTFVNLGVPTVTNGLYSGGDFVADDETTFYVADFDDVSGTGNIRSINTGTGAVTLGAAITGLAAGDVIRNMKWDAATGKMMIAFVTGPLATGVGKIADIDVNTGAVTNIVTLSPSTPLFAVYPHPTTGVLYGASASTDTFFSINKTSGAVTAIGALGQPFDQFSGDGDFSADGNTLYITATVNPPFFNWLMSVNLGTGAATQIADIETARQLGQTSAFGIPHANLVSNVADWTTIE